MPNDLLWRSLANWMTPTCCFEALSRASAQPVLDGGLSRGSKEASQEVIRLYDRERHRDHALLFRRTQFPRLCAKLLCNKPVRELASLIKPNRWLWKRLWKTPVLWAMPFRSPMV